MRRTKTRSTPAPHVAASPKSASYADASLVEPSSSSSPSPGVFVEARADVAQGTVAMAWRKQAALALVRGGAAQEGWVAGVTTDDLKREEVRQWLHLALAPHLAFSVVESQSPLTRHLHTVLDRTIAQVLDNESLVDEIWCLKRHQQDR